MPSSSCSCSSSSCAASKPGNASDREFTSHRNRFEMRIACSRTQLTNHRRTGSSGSAVMQRSSGSSRGGSREVVSQGIVGMYALGSAGNTKRGADDHRRLGIADIRAGKARAGDAEFAEAVRCVIFRRQIVVDHNHLGSEQRNGGERRHKWPGSGNFPENLHDRTEGIYPTGASATMSAGRIASSRMASSRMASSRMASSRMASSRMKEPGTLNG